MRTPWLDLVFGTYHRPKADETFPLGLCEAWPKSYLALLARPLGVRHGTLVTEAASTPLAEQFRTQ